MKASLEWIRELLPELKASPAAVERRLNQSGVEVAGVERPQDALAGVVVAEVRAVRPHPGADRLRVTEVYDGERVHQVVCGAPNVAEGQKVPFAPVGTELPGGLRLESRAIRGVESSGMLCSAGELNLANASEGLLVLKPRLKAGKPLAEALKVKDTVLELDLTPNRADLLSHIGLARELAALFDLPLPVRKAKVRESGPPAEVTVLSADRKRCPLYSARLIRGVRLGPSPLHVQQRLLALGQRPVSNVVDATNLVLLELGHPLHAFDLHKLKGEVRARSARGGETIRLLDGSTKTLTDEDLVIADGRGPIALAGVMGGADSEVDGSTRDILLESALFDPRSVRRSARRHGLHTEASHRFERGVDGAQIRTALNACAALIVELAGGEVAKGVLQDGELPASDLVVPLRPPRAGMLLGQRVERSEIRKNLSRLGLKAVATNRVPETKLRGFEDAVWFRPPSWRTDLNREVDLIEEVARVGGYDRIPSRMPDVAPPVRTRRFAPRADLAVKRELAGMGFRETLSLGFCSGVDAERFGVDPKTLVELQNPLGEETRYLRFSILPALLQVARFNQDQLPSRVDLRLFEMGRTFAWRGPTEQPDEHLRVGLLMRGRRHPPSWGSDDARVDAFDLKGVVDRLSASLGPTSVEPFECPHLHPRASARITVARDAGAVELGLFGQLHPDTMAAYGLEGPEIFVADLAMDGLARAVHRPAFRGVSPHPPAQRDLSFVVRKDQPAASILATIRKTGRSFDLEAVSLFDVYEGAHVPEGHRSLAVALTYRAPDRTLTADEVETAQAEVVRALERVHGARLRG